MARYGKEHKEATRQRIIETAGVRLKQDGIDGAGVAVLMKDAGLTNGAFYGHFDSKEELVAEVVAAQLAAQRVDLASAPEGRAGVEQLVRSYLTAGHVDDAARGCPSAALLDEIARSGDLVRRAYTDGIAAIVDDIATRLDAGGSGGGPGVTRARVMSAVALMVGAVQLARAVTDEDLAREVVEQALVDTLALLDA